MITWSELVSPIEEWWDDMEQWFEDRGVSPVIGALLMVSVTVALSSVMMFFVTTADVGGQSVQANADLYADESGQYIAQVENMGTADRIDLLCDGDVAGSINSDGEQLTAMNCGTVTIIAVDTDRGSEQVLRSYSTTNIPTVSGNVANAVSPSENQHIEDFETDYCDKLEPSDGVYQIENDYDLQCMQYNPTANWELANDISASNTHRWNSYEGFEPIENFSGSFNGNGHTITGLTVYRADTSNVGLFATLESGASVEDVTLRNVDITGDTNVGGLVGAAGTAEDNTVSITDVRVRGDVNGNEAVGGIVGTLAGDLEQARFDGTVGENQASTTVGGVIGKYVSGESTYVQSYATVRGVDAIGGVVGEMSGGSLTNSYVDGDVASVDDEGDFVGTRIGGFVGDMQGGEIHHSESHVSDVEGYENVGGFAGWAAGTITNTSAASDVYGQNRVGGHTGQIHGSVSDSHATGAVRASGYQAGGFVARMVGTVTDSYATGNVSAETDWAGGFAAFSHSNGDSMKRVVATGEVRGERYVGGLIGDSRTTLMDSYSTGDVYADQHVGGFAGVIANAEVSNSYTLGDVHGTENVGGFAGWIARVDSNSPFGSISKSYAAGEVDGTALDSGINAHAFLGENEGTASLVTDGYYYSGYDDNATDPEDNTVAIEVLDDFKGNDIDDGLESALVTNGSSHWTKGADGEFLYLQIDVLPDDE